MTTHRFRFFRAGGVDQVRLESGADVAHLAKLDQKLWVALSCPVKGLEADERTLAFIDVDKDGRVRAGELLGAVAFCEEALVSLDGLVAGKDAVPLASIRAESAKGKALVASAKEVLASLGKPSATEVSLADLADTGAIFAKAPFNGDGVVPADSARDPASRQAILDVLATVGGDTDRGGAAGVSQPKIEAFFAECAAFSGWEEASEKDPANLLPIGERAAAAFSALTAVRAKVDDFFARCRVAAFDARAASAAQGAEAELAAVVAKGLSASASELAPFPLAKVAPGAALPLVVGVNPAWIEALATFRREAVEPLLEARDTLTSDEWAQLQARLAAHAKHAAAKPVTSVEKLGIERIRELLSSTVRAGLEALVAEDRARAPAFDGIADLERLVRYHRDLFRILNNFVAFTDFYDPHRRAIFQAGTLFLDSRSCDLCIRVGDPGRHAALAGLSKCYLAYCDLSRNGGAEKMQIVAVFSNGDSDYLMVGRNGVFYDRQGRDWDATVTKIVENPISIREAFWAPYKKFVRLVEEQVAKRASAADAAASADITKVAETTAHADRQDATKPVETPKKAFDLGTIALLGAAVGGVASLLGAALTAFFGLGVWMPFGLLGLVLAISGPSMLIAWLKLRQRNIGPLLEANGWAINSRAKVNVPLGGSLTHLPEFPDGAQRSLVDPFEPKPSPIYPVMRVAAAVALVAGFTVLGYHQGWLPEAVEKPLAFLGVPRHLHREREVAKARLEEMRDEQSKAQKALGEAREALAKLPVGSDGKQLARAQLAVSRAQRTFEKADEKLSRAQHAFDGADDALLAAEKVEDELEAEVPVKREEAVQAGVPLVK